MSNRLVQTVSQNHTNRAGIFPRLCQSEDIKSQ